MMSLNGKSKPLEIKISVLVVDDEPELLELSKIFLEKENKRLIITTAISASGAIEKLEKGQYDVVVCDYQMPGTNGLELLEILRKQGNSIPFIIFTGRGREEVAIKALNLGANRYIQKGGDPRSQFGILAQAIVNEVKHRQMEELLQLAHFSIEHSADSVFWVDSEARFIHVNEQACLSLGYSRDEFLSMTVYDIDPRYPREKWKEDWQKLRKRGSMRSQPKFKTKNGQFIPVELNIDFFDYSGKEILFGFARDITERKNVEEKLRESEEKYHSLVENIPVVTWITDDKGRISFISANIEKIYGYLPEEIYQAGDQLWFGRIHPEDVEHVKERFNKLFKKNEKYDVQYRIRRKDGHWIWLYNRAITTYEKDGLIQAYGVFSDITEQKLMEEAVKTERNRLLLILEELPGIVYLQGPDLSVRFSNRYVRDYFGDLEKQPCYIVFEGRSEPCESCTTLQVLETGKPQEIERTLPDGRNFHNYSYPLTDVDGTPLVLKVGFEIKERE